MTRVLFCLLFSLISPFIFAQGTGVPLGNPTYDIVNRLEIKTGITPHFHSGLRYYTRGDITRYALSLDTASIRLSIKDRRDLYYIFKDNNEWLGEADEKTTIAGTRVNAMPGTELSMIEASMDNARYTTNEKPLLKHLYKTPANLFEVNEKYFHLRVNPLLDLRFGLIGDRENDQSYLFNRRGIELRGGVDDRIFFYFNIVETQAQFPQYIVDYVDRTGAVPRNGFLKTYTSDIFGVEDGYDFLNGQGYLGFNVTKHVGVQFGYGRNFIGNGYRSLILSDFAHNYLYLKLNWNVWKFHYQNIFAELSLQSDRRKTVNPIPNKYMAAHHLSINILPNLNVGVFETVIFSRPNHFEFKYLNPVILYRTIEQGLGSPDNVLIGMDAKWNFLKRFQLYGQLMLDEFVFSELVTNNQGWWANKYGIQAGLKYIDAFGIDHLDLQAEYNQVRPYTYTHRDSSAYYAHYDTPLAHPLGANFKELIFKLRYQPSKRWLFESRVISAQLGEDTPDSNWGSNILLSFQTREQEYNNETGQGIGADLLIFGFDASYQIYHNMFLDFEYFYRNKDSENNDWDQVTQYIGGGIRINLAKENWDF